jgi:hypothetical protein
MSKVIAWMMFALLGTQAQLIVPANTTVIIAGGSYSVVFEKDVFGPVRSKNGIALTPVAAAVTCPVGMMAGRIVISSQLQPKQQAIAMIHETVHIAQTCDKRALPVDEKIAQDVSDLFDSPEGLFIMKELR